MGVELFRLPSNFIVCRLTIVNVFPKATAAGEASAFMSCSDMANIFARFLLFLSSYIPLWVIFTVIMARGHFVFACGFALLAAVSLFGTLIYIRHVQRMNGIQISVGIIRRQDSETMSYIASYVVPFAATALDNFEQVIALGIFLIVLCIVYVNTSMIHINPLLSVLGYNLFEIEDRDGNTQFLISKRRVRRGETINVIDIADGIFMEKRL